MNNKVLIIEKRQLLKEDWWENLLMVAGFVPVIGEVADIILIITYIRRKEYLYAALMLIALIPTVGDAIAKPFIKLLGRYSAKTGKAVTKNADDYIKFLNENPNLKAFYKDLGKHFDDKVVTETINRLHNVPGMKGIASKLNQSINTHKSIWSRLFGKPQQIGKSIGKEMTAGVSKPIGAGITKYFRREQLKNYIKKNGHKPSNWFYMWWNVVYLGSWKRRQYVKNFIYANKLLDFFNLPSYESFVRKIQNDANFREQLVANPQMEQLIKDMTNENDLNAINNKLDSGNEEKSGGFGNFFNTMFTFNLLKTMAQKLI